MKQTGIILAGGRGTRLAGVLTDRPKPLAMVAGKPFIEWVISYFSKYDIRDFIVSLGHLAKVAEAYFAARESDDVSITTITEREPMGTGGAFRYAAQGLKSDVYVLINGDSLLLADLCPARLLLEQDEVDGVIIGRNMEDASRYGTLRVADDGILTGFSEKQAGSGVINGGIYLLKQRLLEQLPGTVPMSMEREGIPALLAQVARIMVSVSEAPFLDIGLPETLAEAGDFIQKHF